MSPIVESCLLYYLHRVQGHYQRIVQNVAKRASEAASPSLHFLQLRGTFANANTGNGEIDDQGKAKKRAMLTVSSNGHGEKFAMHRRIAPCLAIHCEQTQDKSNFTPSRRQVFFACLQSAEVCCSWRIISRCWPMLPVLNYFAFLESSHDFPRWLQKSPGQSMSYELLHRFEGDVFVQWWK